MGEKINIQPEVVIPYCSHYVLHSDSDGIYQDIVFSDEIEKNIFRKELYKKAGDPVEHFDNAAKALGIMFLKFSSMDEMLDKMNHMNEHIKVILK